MGGQPLRCLLNSDILDKDELGVTQKISGIKTIIQGTIIATKASATFIICRVLPGSAKHPADQTGNCHIGRTGWQNGSSLPTSLWLAQNAISFCGIPPFMAGG